MTALERESVYGIKAKELYTKEEVAQLLSVSLRTVEELISKGRLGSVLLKSEPRARRGIRRISRAQIEAYIDKLEVEAKFKR